jgi:heme exporter protein D
VSEYLAMGGYGFYIWSSYGVMAIVIGVEIIAVRARRRTILEEARLALPESTSTVFPGGVS